MQHKRTLLLALLASLSACTEDNDGGSHDTTSGEAGDGDGDARWIRS
ncbi:MAG: hypothetical protein V3W44_00205 [Dehalococcoidales bacterium]